MKGGARHIVGLCRARHRRLLPRRHAQPRGVARYSIMIQDVQEVIAPALGGETVTTTVGGSPALRRQYAVSPGPPSQSCEIASRRPGADAAGWCRAARRGVAKITLDRGPTSIRTENGQLAT